MIRQWLPKKHPHHPPDYDEQVVYAVRAWAQGKASEPQQLLLWDYLMYVTGASVEFADLMYRPDEEGGGGVRATEFAEGKRFVGLMIRKLLRPEFTPKPPKIEDDVSRAVRALAMRRNASKARGK